MGSSISYLTSTLDALRRRRGDSTSIEVKRASGGTPALRETVCAFANMPEGGTIILGVDEDRGSFEVVGVDHPAELEAAVVDQARSTVRPCPHIESEVVDLDGRQVLVLRVAPLRIADRPAMTGGVAYLRQSDGDYRMHEHELRMIEVAKLHLDEQSDYDVRALPGLSREDLDEALVDEYVSAVRRRDRRLRDADDDEILTITGVLRRSGEPTLAGLYGLGTYPQGRFPALTVTAAVQLRGDDGQTRSRNLEDFTGPVPVLLEDIMDWVSRSIGTVQRYRGDGHLATLPELPLHAVRELVANALVHRDLGPNTLDVGKAVQVRLTPRSLFIQSPGGLRGVSISQLESDEHAQAAVNQRLYQIAKKLVTGDGASVIEGEGGGIRAVFRGAAAHGLPRPQLSNTGVQVTALLWRPTDEELTAAGADGARGEHGSSGDRPPLIAEQPAGGKPLVSSDPTRNEAAVLTELSRRATGASLAELSKALDLTERQIRYALGQPLADGIVAMSGGRGHRDTVYSVVRAESPAD